MSALSRQKATALTRAAQVSLALLLVGGGTALAMSMRSREAAERPGPLVLPVVEVGGKKAEAAARADIDAPATATRLGAISNRPVPVEVPKVEAPVPVTPVAPVNDLRYLGAVALGDLKLALVAENGKQRFVAVGDSLEGGTVESISDGEVRIGGSAGKTLTLAGRSGDVVTRAGGMRNGPMGSATPMPGSRPLGANGLPVYQPPSAPMAAVLDEQQQMRAKNNIPDYVRPGDEQDFLSTREQIRSVEKFGSEEELNEVSSKRLEEQRGTSPDTARQRILNDPKRKSPR